jgi:hypothetical protein
MSDQTARPAQMILLQELKVEALPEQKLQQSCKTISSEVAWPRLYLVASFCQPTL